MEAAILCRCGDQTATREACLRAWRLPADAPPVADHPDIDTFYLREVLGAEGKDDMPRAATVQPVRCPGTLTPTLY